MIIENKLNDLQKDNVIKKETRLLIERLKAHNDKEINNIYLNIIK